MTRTLPITPSYASSCQGKIRYRKKEAKRALRGLMAIGGTDIEVYRCRYCAWWHVGHTIGALRRDGSRARTTSPRSLP